MSLSWHGVLLVEGIPTTDGRLIESGAVTFERELPLSLMDCRGQTDHGDALSPISLSPIGLIEVLLREGPRILGSGRWLGEDLPVGTKLWVGGDIGGMSYEQRDDLLVITWPAPLYAAAIHDEGQSCWPEAFITITEATL